MTELEQKYQALVQKQRGYFNTDETLNINFRLGQLKKLKALLIQHETALSEAIYKDFGKSKYECQLTEIKPVLSEIDYALKHLKQWSKFRRVRNNLLNFPGKSYLVPEPLGVSLVIGAWNFPYNLSLLPIVGSMMAGNVSVLKPSELPAHTSAIMAKIINDHFDADYLHVIEGAIPETTALLNQRWDKVFFTGSPAVGKIVNQSVAGNLTNVTLELGGKNPVVFDKNCALSVGVKRMIWAKFLNAGQLCIAPDYVLVHKDIKHEFLKTAVEEINKANYSLENKNFVQIINESNFDRIVHLINPTKVYFGGQYDRKKRLIQPTILTDIVLDDAIMQEEIFGPLLPVIEYEHIDEAFAFIREFEKPLAGYIYTNNAEHKNKFLRKIPFGNGGVNESVMQISNANLPFGGVGNSGIGNYHGKYSFECFSHCKAVLEKSTVIESNLKYYGYSNLRMKIMNFLN